MGRGRLNRLGALVVAAGVLAGSFVAFRWSISDLMDIGVAVSMATFGWSHRGLRDDDLADRAFAASLLAAAILATVVLGSFYSVHSWSWVTGAIAALVPVLMTRAGGWRSDRLDRKQPEDALPDLHDPTLDVWKQLPRY